VQAHNELALAYILRARETADLTYLEDADAALTQGLKQEPESFSLQKTQVVLMLSRHEFSQARERATILNHRMPDDVTTYDISPKQTSRSATIRKLRPMHSG